MWYGHRADRRAEKADEREALPFEREENAAEEQKRARLTAEYAGYEGGPQGRIYKYQITNQGPAPARRVSVWFVDEEGREIGQRDGGRVPLAKDEQRVFRPSAPPREVYSGLLKLRYGWKDERPEWQEQDSDVGVPLR